MRYALSDSEWGTIQPILPDKSRGVPRPTAGAGTRTMSARACVSVTGSAAIARVAGVNPRSPHDVDAKARRRRDALAGFFL